MEEWIGNLWHQWISKTGHVDYPEAAAHWSDHKERVGFIFRGLGGKHHIQLEQAAIIKIHQHKNIFQHIGGTGCLNSLPIIQQDKVSFPTRIAIFPEKKLNENLYLWWAALASQWRFNILSSENRQNINTPITMNHWFIDNQNYISQTLTHFPGLKPIYDSLVKAHLVQRASPSLNSDNISDNERKVRMALEYPTSENSLAPDNAFPAPIPLWFYPDTHLIANRQSESSKNDASDYQPSSSKSKQINIKKKAESIEESKNKGGLLLLRLENLFSWSEMINVDRPQDDDSSDDEERIAEDLERISISKRGHKSSSKIKFDLDLPSEYVDDEPLGEGLLLPEWNYKKNTLINDHCCLQTLINTQGLQVDLPKRLASQARQIRAQFAQLAPNRKWQNRQYDGHDLDIDAWVDYHQQSQIGTQGELKPYRALNKKDRDISCLLLADLSLSTDAHINDKQKIIDVIKDSMFLFSEALHEVGDAFSLYGFSSKKRHTIRYHQIKHFSETYSPIIRGRIDQLTSGFYTRMGAAIRHSCDTLLKQPQKQRILLILTDGKPNDIDQYEGRYGIEDTRQAVKEAQQKGIHPFAITIDQEAQDYLPYIFGQQGFLLIRRAEELPLSLLKLYQQIST